MELTLVFAFVLGVFIDTLATYVYNCVRSARGVLRIDHSNPQKDLYLFEIDDIEKLGKKKYVNLKIDHKANLSQK